MITKRGLFAGLLAFIVPGKTAAGGDGIALRSMAHPGALAVTTDARELTIGYNIERVDLSEAAVENFVASLDEFTTDNLFVKCTYRIVPMVWSAGQ